MRRTMLCLMLASVLAGCSTSDTEAPATVGRPTTTPTVAAAVEPTAAYPTSESAVTRPTVDPNVPPVNPACAGVTQFPAEPQMSIDPTAQYTATIKTVQGDMVMQLFPEYAPRTVNSFVFLAKQGYYDNVTFHRVLEGFMAQGGDPSGTGMCGPGYEFDNEYNPESGLDYSKAGVLAMANAGPNTNGSQFFITFAPTPLQPNEYTIFGQLVEGEDVLQKITLRNPDLQPTTLGDLIYTIEITDSTER